MCRPQLGPFDIGMLHGVERATHFLFDSGKRDDLTRKAARDLNKSLGKECDSHLLKYEPQDARARKKAS